MQPWQMSHFLPAHLYWLIMAALLLPPKRNYLENSQGTIQKENALIKEKDDLSVVYDMKKLSAEFSI